MLEELKEAMEWGASFEDLLILTGVDPEELAAE